MGLTIWLQARIDYDESFMTKEEWDDVFRDNRQALIELLNEDMTDVLEMAGGLKEMVVDAKWSKAKPRRDKPLTDFRVLTYM